MHAVPLLTHDHMDPFHRQPTACGITTLGFDHMGILGKTLAEIAWQKAGIFKVGLPATLT